MGTQWRQGVLCVEDPLQGSSGSWYSSSPFPDPTPWSEEESFVIIDWHLAAAWIRKSGRSAPTPLAGVGERGWPEGGPEPIHLLLGRPPSFPSSSCHLPDCCFCHNSGTEQPGVYLLPVPNPLPGIPGVHGRAASLGASPNSIQGQGPRLLPFRGLESHGNDRCVEEKGL